MGRRSAQAPAWHRPVDRSSSPRCLDRLHGPKEKPHQGAVVLTASNPLEGQHLVNSRHGQDERPKSGEEVLPKSHDDVPSGQNQLER